MKPSVTSVDVLSLKDDVMSDQKDLLAAEEPLEIRIKYAGIPGKTGKSLAVTMRTPGHDAELVTGFLYTEGIIRSYNDIEEILHLYENENVISVTLRDDVSFDPVALERHFYMTSSCGICGKSSIENVKLKVPHEPGVNGIAVSSEVIFSLNENLKAGQVVFKHTGGLHASALFTQEGKLVLLREDVGRHNALDKLCGAALASGMVPLKQYILLLSGRASFELMQKAAMAGISVVAAIGAPSGLAVEMAQDTGITLIGFLRDRRFNIYTHRERIRMI